MESIKHLIFDQDEYSHEMQVNSEKKEYEYEIDHRVYLRIFSWWQDTMGFTLNPYELSIRLNIDRKSIIDKALSYMIQSSSAVKSLNLTSKKIVRDTDLVKIAEGSRNVRTLWIGGSEDNDTFFAFHKALYKMNTNKLESLGLTRLKITLNDVMKCMHICSSLTELRISNCQVHGNPEDIKLNLKARFKLNCIVFDNASYDFKLKDFAKELMQNKSLKKKLTINYWSTNRKHKAITLKKLKV